ncbi:MAG: 23S rRNA (guanosine(2251)-2'-O)-methyltransferase RlmB [Polyangiaceae bacterium]
MSRLVYGVQPVREVLRVHEKRTERLWLASDGSPKIDGLARLAESRGVNAERVPKRELDRLTKNGQHQGAVAEAPALRILDEESLAKAAAASPTSVVVILDGIMDPMNFGAVVRSAIALGAPFIVWPEHGAAPLSPAMFRASAGAIEYATLARVRSLPSVIAHLQDAAFQVVLLEGSSEGRLDTLDLTGPTALIVGSEDKGARGAVRRAVNHRARLPLARTVESLNASVAAGIALYEVARQRGF